MEWNPVVKLLMPEIKEAIRKRDWDTLTDVVSSWEPIDIADLLTEIELEDALTLFRLLPPELQSEAFAKLDVGLQQTLLERLSDAEAKAFLSEIKPDDRTELLEELPEELAHRILQVLTPEDRKEALELLAFPENSVGRLLTPDYVAVKPSWTIGQALEHIRRNGRDAETIDVIYVVDDNGFLLDDIPIRRFILAHPEERVEAIMDHSVVSIVAEADQEEAVRLMEKYDLICLPVTDSKGKLLGIVTVDDMVDVLQEEQTEDFTKLSAIEAPPVDLDFITKIKEVPLTKLYRSRITWLFLLLVMDMVTGGIIQGFESTIARYVVLVTFLPVLVDTAGNAGSQSATLVIRAMALGTVEMRDWIYLLGRELFVAGALGLTMGLGISFMGIFRGGSAHVALVVVLTMIINVIVGSLIGVLLPFIFSKLKKDPATASTPLVTTLADIVGTAIYLGIASFMLR
ncbi:MAG: magnesium transporter [candidate division KSB1 bacterium]|nr:magnesium transporter [candidate division KSB1 bacterium]